MNENAIQAELAALLDIFRDVPEDKRRLFDNLIQNAAFMAVTLKELQKDIVTNGAKLDTVSGNGFRTMKDNPSVKAYTTMISRYITVIDLLTDHLPSDNERAKDELLEFLRDN